MPRYNTEIFIDPYVTYQDVEDPDLAKRILQHNRVQYASIGNLQLEHITRAPEKSWYTVTYLSTSGGKSVSSLDKATAEGLEIKVAIDNRPEYRVIVAGGRDFDDPDFMAEKLDSILSTRSKTHRITIVEGGARGADQHGERYAASRGYRVDEHPADWDTHGKSAGYKRNEEMAGVADACVCFWDGQSRGTKHMIDIATKFKLPLRVIRYTV